MDGIMVVVDRLGRSIVELEQVNAELQRRLEQHEQQPAPTPLTDTDSD